MALPALAKSDLPDWAGYWAVTPEWCARAGLPGDETPEYIAPDGIFGLEYSCDFLEVTPTGVGKSWIVRLKCMDAGEESVSREIFAITSDDKLLRIGNDGWVVSQHRCAKGVTQ